MIPESSHLKGDPLKNPAMIVSQPRQEEVCKDIYDYLVSRKLQKLKEAVLHFNKVIKKILE